MVSLCVEFVGFAGRHVERQLGPTGDVVWKVQGDKQTGDRGVSIITHSVESHKTG